MRLTLKALQGLAILDQIFGEKLQSYKSMEFDIFSFVHHAHPTTAKLLDDAVVRDGFTDHWQQECYGE